MPAHVAILLKRYIRMILDGSKTVESRLTRTNRAPFGSIKPGERIYFKASSGPYMATAVAEKVAFYDKLTPDAVAKLKRNFNARVCGDDAYWQWKRDSRFATFVLLRDVQAMDVGPEMPPSQGVAWFVIDERVKQPAVFDVALTDGAIRNGYLRIARKVHTFPAACYGGPTVAEAGDELELLLPGGQTVRTDLVANMVRWRGWGKLYREHNVAAGDAVRFIEHAPGRYRTVFVAKKAT